MEIGVLAVVVTCFALMQGDTLSRPVYLYDFCIVYFDI